MALGLRIFGLRAQEFESRVYGSGLEHLRLGVWGRVNVEGGYAVYLGI